MKKTIFLALFLTILSIRSGYAQSSFVQLPDSSMIISLEKTIGFGPQGQTSMAIGSSDLQNVGEHHLYPVLANIPKLRNVKSFFYVYNMPQFYYQNYKSGKLSKSSFIEIYKKHNLDLADTLLLSKKAINTLISAITAQDSSGKDVFLVDANHNNDFSDDVIRSLPEDGYISNIEEIASRISIASFSNNKVNKENILVVIRKSGGSSAEQSLLSFAFPEFRYVRFGYGGKEYLLCTNVLSTSKTPIFLLPDIPSFSPAPNEARINPTQLLRLGADNFVYVAAENNGQRLIFKKNKSGDINLPGAEKTSSQAGHLAPEIRGINLEDGKFINLSAQKGKYVFIDFWSTTCGACIADFPALVKLYDGYDKEKIEFIGMADERQKGKVEELLSSHKIKWPTLISNTPTTTYSGYHIFSYPTSFLVAPDGRILKLDLRSGELKNVLDALLK